MGACDLLASDTYWRASASFPAPSTVLTSPNRQWTAKVRADGTLITAEHRGSIHQVGAAVQGAPACNGWTFWHIEHEGELKPIDAIRKLYLLATED